MKPFSINLNNIKLILEKLQDNLYNKLYDKLLIELGITNKFRLLSEILCFYLNKKL